MAYYYIFYSGRAYSYHTYHNPDMLGKYGPGSIYYFAAFTRLMDAQDYINKLKSRD